MKLKQLIADDDAVSPVIGVILMVAITVILAAVIGTFVLGLGDQVNETAPQASFNFDFAQDNSTNSDNAEVTITHESGSSIDSSLLAVTVDGTDVTTGSDTPEYLSGGFSGEVSAGDSAVVQMNSGVAGGSDWDGEVIRVVWTSESGSTSATLQKQTAP